MNLNHKRCGWKVPEEIFRMASQLELGGAFLRRNENQNPEYLSLHRSELSERRCRPYGTRVPFPLAPGTRNKGRRVLLLETLRPGICDLRKDLFALWA